MEGDHRGVAVDGIREIHASANAIGESSSAWAPNEEHCRAWNEAAGVN